MSVDSVHNYSKYALDFSLKWLAFVILLCIICYKNAIGNANKPMRSNIAYFRNKYCIAVNGLSKNITNLVSEPKLSTEQLIVIQNLRDLLDNKK